MNDNIIRKPDYIFEVSWEICNKVGGIYTVLSTKTQSIVKDIRDNLILIGPDVWMEARQNPDFIEDKYIYKFWREKAEREGLKIRIGRWNIASEPIVILVDFTPYFSNKDQIFTDFWKTYKLDSLSGQWDYTEPALFGYAAGKVIESFYDFNLSAQDAIIAQFHEWMTGTGILFLKQNVPQVGCVFTTHATVLGRCIAGNNLPLYRDLKQFNAEVLSVNFGVRSKFSLEKLSAKESDAFTTVSHITALECEQFFDKPVDVVTPNGFDDSFVPPDDVFEEKRAIARQKLFGVAKAVLNQDIPDDTLLVVNSGRYEFKNKGIDIYIEALSRLNDNPLLTKQVLAYIMVPANHSGPLREVIERLNNPDFNTPLSGKYLSHGLHEAEFDPILKALKKSNLSNNPLDKVKIIFVPSYLMGNDGIFNLDYYQLLIGFDISVFPSYYEPWGYTPLESLAFHVPTITTTLAGFGMWIKNTFNTIEKGVGVIERNDDNDNEVINDIAGFLLRYVNKTPEERLQCMQEAFKISRIALWENLIDYYYQAYSVALGKAYLRYDSFKEKVPYDYVTSLPKIKKSVVDWKKVYISSTLPAKFSSLRKIANNLWWTWNYEAIELFEMIDKILWEKSNHNPIVILETLSIRKLKKLERDKGFITKLKEVSKKFDDYMAKAEGKKPDIIAYFSMEFGFHESFKIYSGGLGILAGDYLKQASDSNENIVGIGLLYRYGYFNQSLSIFGDQIVKYEPQKFSFMPLNPVRDKMGNWEMITLALPGRTLHAKIWKVDIGRIPLYLLDTDIEENTEADRSITHNLYGGDWENRLKQEMLLGIGGIRMLQSINIQPTIYHCNEGHAALIGLERLRNYVEDKKFSFLQAMELVRNSSLFTTHTPVPAGHDAFHEDLIRAYLPQYYEKLNISWEEFINLGRIHDNDTSEKFSMSVLALKLSLETNGVSRIHGKVTQQMFSELYNGYFPEELYISYVTNGVHYPTWTAPIWRKLYEREFGENFLSDHSNPELWKKIREIPDEVIWDIRRQLKNELINFLKVKLQHDMTERQENPKLIFATLDALNNKALTIGFARRFATYKRAHLIFNNLERLASLVNKHGKPVHFIFAGKAHPHDKAGEEFIKKIVEISKHPEFMGKITFVENYDMAIARKLVQGVDIWLNLPTRPLEASGTSGQKAVLNGVMNFSVLDGWWAEGYTPDAGWALPEENTYSNPVFQDELDAETVYHILEDEIIPLYYNLDHRGIPVHWISNIKNCIAQIAPRFTMKRQLDDYCEMYYEKLIRRTRMIEFNDFEVTKRLAHWKRKILRSWDSIEVVSVLIPDSTTKPLQLGAIYEAEIVLDVNELSVDDIGIEVLFGQKQNDEVHEILYCEEMEKVKTDKSLVTFKCTVPATRAGVFDYAFRMFPKNNLLPHRQDFNLIRWI